ncbi:MAG: NAD(P)-dependent oxidoreductase [Rhizobium sp.]|nr:NAD(P)-dependent oxidoreductase [Rhizobium sp.]
MSRLVVTGATGFIGNSIVEAALQRNHDVVALARNPSWLPRQSTERLHVKRWQVGEPLPEVGEAKALIHLAAHVPADFSDAKAASSCFDINVLGAMEIAEQAADQGIEKFIHFSSGQIYSTELTSATEQSLAYPVGRATYYLASKLAGELCVQYVTKRRNIEVIVFRLASIYGPGMHPKGMLPHFVQRLADGEVVHLAEGGGYHVDFAYIGDVIDITFSALASRASGIFNVGSGVASTSLQAATVIADVLGADRKLIEVEGEKKENGFAALDVTKARESFGFQPRSLEEGVSAWLGHERETIQSR